MGLFARSSNVIELTPADFNKRTKHLIPPVDMLGKKGMIVFSASWCGHCKRAAPEIARAAKILGKSFIVYNLDCDKYKDFAAQALNITGYPTIVFINSNGSPSKLYKGERSTQAFLEEVCKVSMVCPLY